MFDQTQAESGRIKSFIGKSDRDKTGAYQASMRDVESRLVGMPSTGAAARRPDVHEADRPADVDLKSDDLYLKGRPAQMDLAVAALACDQPGS